MIRRCRFDASGLRGNVLGWQGQRTAVAAGRKQETAAEQQGENGC